MALEGHRCSVDVSSDGSGVCELTNQSRLVVGRETFKRQELKQSVSNT